jgi:hypothetical protein
MPVPLPTSDVVDLAPPRAEETRRVIAGVLGAVAPEGGPTRLQRELFAALSESMTGHQVDTATLEPLGPVELAETLALRNTEYRLRISQLMLLGELVLPTVPAEVSDRVARYISELSITDDFVTGGRRSSGDSLGLALVDFARNGYSANWNPEQFPLHTDGNLHDAWQQAPADSALAERWRSLGECDPGTIGRAVFAFYRNRGFNFPGTPGSAPPLLAQHDWIHVLADYGATIDSEVEVFGFIARSSPNPAGFSLLAMVIGLFETGAVEHGAGAFFSSDVGHLSRTGMTSRLADAFLRGARCGRDLMTVDWFTYADRPLDEVREEFGVTAKSEAAVAAGSASPWEAGGITEYQLEAGRANADREGRHYEPLLPL